MSETATTSGTGDFALDNPGLWTQYRTTPWRDLLRGRLTGALDYRPLIAEAELPASVKTLIDDVVTRTRLWPRECQDVARDLCAHFTDGLAAGRSLESLVAEFGEPATAAALIRRAKIRCRGRVLSLWHRLWLTGLGIIVLLVMIGAIQVIQFYSMKPTVRFDLVAQHDEKSRDIPQEDRAWPFYRRGLVTIDRSDLTPPPPAGLGKINIREALIEGPTHVDWPLARAYLSEKQEAVRLFTEGASRAELGFINRDPENEAWRRWDTRTQVGWETYNPPGTGGPMILLAQLQDLRIVFSFLQGTMHAAIEDGNGPPAVEMALRLLQLSDHARQTHDGRVADRVAFYYFSQTVRQTQRLVRDHSDLVTTSDLSKLSERIRAALGGGRIAYRLDGELRMWQDFLQRVYSDDGNGNGQMTPAGLDRIVEYSRQRTYDREMFNPLSYVYTKDDDGRVSELSAMLAGSAVAELVADRKTMEQKIIELNALHREMMTDIDTPPSDSRYFQEVRCMARDEPLRFLPFTVFVDKHWGEWENNYGSPARRLVAVNLQRNAALLTIALERYRRQTGDWPEALTELVPEWLPSVPVDLFADEETRPLIYRVVDGMPLVYSVGPDHTDNGGQFPDDDVSGWKADTGDWRLIPPEEEQE